LIEKPLPADDPLQRQPVIDLAKQELGWQPEVPQPVELWLDRKS